jgi:hypothetical protein
MTRVCLLALVACSSPSKMQDAPANGDGMCGTDDLFTGEIVDWDSTNDTFCGVLGANLAAEGNPAETASTANHPNGRFQMCLTPADQTVVAITPPTDTSECAPAAGLYQIGGVAIATHAVIASGQLNSLRMIGMTRAAAFFPQFGSGLDDTKAIVFVHVDGTASAVTSSAAHDSPIAFDGSAWAAGDTGVYVVFPNTDVSTGSSSVGFADGTGIGGGNVPVAAHQFTYLNLVAQ